MCAFCIKMHVFNEMLVIKFNEQLFLHSPDLLSKSQAFGILLDFLVAWRNRTNEFLSLF